MPNLPPPPPPGFELDNDTTPAAATTPLLRRQPTPQTTAQAQHDTNQLSADRQNLRNDELAGQKTQLEIGKLRREAEAKTKDFDEARSDMVNVIDHAMTATHMSGNSNTTGLRGSIFSKIPGTEARDLAGHLDSIGANVAFSRLQKMRQESPTGGALGNISDTDMRLLKSVITSLDQSRSKGEFQKSMRRVIQVYSKILVKMPGGRDALIQWRDQWLKANRPKQPAHSDGWSIEEAP